MGNFWAVALVAGPILLLTVAIYVWARNRQASRGTVARSERGARELREDPEDKQARTLDP